MFAQEILVSEYADQDAGLGRFLALCTFGLIVWALFKLIKGRQ